MLEMSNISQCLPEALLRLEPGSDRCMCLGSTIPGGGGGGGGGGVGLDNACCKDAEWDIRRERLQRTLDCTTGVKFDIA